MLAGYRFDGWFTEAQGGSAFVFSTVIEGDITLYAHWTRRSDAISPGVNEGEHDTAIAGEKVVQSADTEAEFNLNPAYSTDLEVTAVTVYVATANPDVFNVASGVSGEVIESGAKLKLTLESPNANFGTIGEDVTYYITVTQTGLPESDRVPVKVILFGANTITVTQPTNGGTITSSRAQANENDIVTLTITPETSWKFISLKVNNGEVKLEEETEVPSDENPVTTTKNYTFAMPNENVTVTAETKEMYSITLDPAQPDTAGNKVAVTSVSGQDPINLQDVAEGTEVTLTVTVATDYQLTNLEVKDASDGKVNLKDSDSTSNATFDTPVAGATEKTYKFTMPAKSVTVKATFDKIYTISITSPASGTDSNGNKVIAVPAEKAIKGTEVALTVTVQEGYQCTKLEIKANGTDVKLTPAFNAPLTTTGDTTYKFSMPEGNVDINAEFGVKPAPVTVGKSETELTGANLTALKLTNAKLGSYTLNGNPGAYTLTGTAYFVDFDNTTAAKSASLASGSYVILDITIPSVVTGDASYTLEIGGTGVETLNGTSTGSITKLVSLPKDETSLTIAFKDSTGNVVASSTVSWTAGEGGLKLVTKPMTNYVTFGTEVDTQKYNSTTTSTVIAQNPDAYTIYTSEKAATVYFTGKSIEQSSGEVEDFGSELSKGCFWLITGKANGTYTSGIAILNDIDPATSSTRERSYKASWLFDGNDGFVYLLKLLSSTSTQDKNTLAIQWTYTWSENGNYVTNTPTNYNKNGLEIIYTFDLTGVERGT